MRLNIFSDRLLDMAWSAGGRCEGAIALFWRSPKSLHLHQKFEVSLASVRAGMRWTSMGYSWLHWRMLDPSSSPSANALNN